MVAAKVNPRPQTHDARRSRKVGDRNLLSVTTLEALEPVLTLMLIRRVA